MNWSPFGAALFDLDGVITPTAESISGPGRRCSMPISWNPEPSGGPFTEDDYLAYVDGKPRYDGVRSFLASRDVHLPEGTPDDDPDAQTVCGLGNRKNEFVTRVLEREGVEAYPGSVALVDALEARGIAMAIVSSSKNAPNVLRAAGLLDRFPVIVDGIFAAEHGIAGKPAPDTYVRAAAELGVATQRCVVFEDAISGVQAGRDGDFGLVVGVDRGAGADELRHHGADVVVTDLDQLLPED
ncbi:MAG: HAD-IA family hydrolase [Ilumatobacteraceae bacterium]